MARLKRSSPTLEMARRRLAGLKTIDPAPNFGSGLTVAGYETEVQALSNELDGYNGDVVALDNRQNGLEALESSLQDKNRRFLSAVEGAYGPDSTEFEAAGGTRKSERKRPVRKNKIPT